MDLILSSIANDRNVVCQLPTCNPQIISEGIVVQTAGRQYSSTSCAGYLNGRLDTIYSHDQLKRYTYAIFSDSSNTAATCTNGLIRIN